jgi:CDP-paratose 2-epimerase
VRVLVTGSSGLIGSEAVRHYDARGDEVVGIDNNMRRDFFGPAGDTTWNLERLVAGSRRFRHVLLDVRDREGVFSLVRERPFDMVVHCAAQPSHDKSREIPLLDFEVNALGTLNLLEAVRLYSGDAVIVHMSTNKVYGDAPNEIPLVEREKRYDYARSEDYHGVSEECRIDRSLHSLFGASKTAADVLAQEYGRNYRLNVGIFRAGCVTGAAHSGVELHGFLSYLVKTACSGKTYTIFGYKGKQVRDNIHSSDVVQAFEEFRSAPRPGEVYNLGGGRDNSISILEAIDRLEKLLGRPVDARHVDQNRPGDHVCYISDVRKLRAHFPRWEVRRSLDDILSELVESEERSRREEP